MAPLPTKLLEEIVDAYGNLNETNYRFVEKRHSSNMHHDVVQILQENYEMRETTDFNDDVCRTFFLSNSHHEIGLRLSLVGLYAAVSDKRGRLVDEDERHLCPGINEIEALLMLAHYHMTWKADLVVKVPFGGRADFTLYEILYSSDEAILA